MERADNNPESKDAFFKRMDQTVLSGFTTVSLALGRKLRLFEAFGDSGKAVTSSELASRAKCKERYVREWLHHMVVSDVVEVDDSGKLFTLSADRQQVLTDPNNLVHGMSSLIPYLMIPHREIVECFRDDGPSGVPFETVRPALMEFSELYGGGYAATVDKLVKEMPDLKKSLESGIKVCDIGPGEGKMMLHWAAQFPNSKFIGIELSENLFQIFKEQIAARGLTNVEVHNLDASALPEEWNDSIDYVLMHNVVHDLPYPLKVLKSVHGCIKPGGHLSVFEENLSTNINQANKNPREKRTELYIIPISIYHCLSSSMYYPGSAGLGPCCGTTAIQELLESAGFKVSNAQEKSEDDMAHFYCEKVMKA